MKRGITQDKELMTLRIATLHDFTWEEEDRRGGRGGKTTPLIFFPFFTLMKKVANKKIPPFVILFTSASFLFKSIITPPHIYNYWSKNLHFGGERCEKWQRSRSCEQYILFHACYVIYTVIVFINFA